MWITDMDHNNANNSLFITRNQHLQSDHRNFSLQLSGFGDWGIWRYQPHVAVQSSYLVEFENYVPKNLGFEMVNGEVDEKMGFAICYPVGTVINKVFTGLNNKKGQAGPPSVKGAGNMTMAGSRGDVDGAHFYWDAESSLLFISVEQTFPREDYGNFCPQEGCNFVWINATIPMGAKPRRCIDSVYEGAKSIQETSGYFFDQK
jgi:hypothetical protein